MAGRHVTKSRRVYVGDRRWTIQRVRYPRDRDGDCDWSKRLIRLADSLVGVQLLDALLHELLHARFGDLAEDVVDEFASTAAGILDSEGFKQADDHEEG
jgi:hypothetical protein